MFRLTGKYTYADVMIDDVDQETVSQIYSFINHPAFTNPIAIMPDCHAGKGSVIGFTMQMADKLIPNVIGVDIGCGMLTSNVGKNINLSLSEIDRKIRQKIPFGANYHKRGVMHMDKDFPWKQTNVIREKFRISYRDEYGIDIDHFEYDMNWFRDKCKTIRCDFTRAISSLGTLGGGNHFCELGVDLSGDHWFTIHSGSRNFGKCVCEYWQNKAKKDFNDTIKVNSAKNIDDLKSKYSGDDLYRKIQEEKQKKVIVSEDQLWLEGDAVGGYLTDMIFAQMYADVNRSEMMKIVLDVLGTEASDTISTIHNFIDFNDFIIRKGAIRSYNGGRMIIPFNMRDGILICEGKSNVDWNYSAPHGAGRVLSRSKAKKTIDVESFKEQMKDIYSTSVGYSTLDEAPDAYKDAKMIEEAITDTATITHRIKPILNMKDGVGERDD